jgi:hypothetical protein
MKRFFKIQVIVGCGLFKFLPLLPIKDAISSKLPEGVDEANYRLLDFRVTLIYNVGWCC